MNHLAFLTAHADSSSSPSVQILNTGVPAYIRVEEALIGVFDAQNAANVEFADSRFVGYTSDLSVSETISRSEIDPCTEKITDYSVGSGKPSGPRNKWEWRAGSSTLVKYARGYKATASSGTKTTNSGQILAGQFVTPIGEWIFPKLTLPGRQLGPNDLSQFTHLRDGIGPGADNNMWGQLIPQPGASAPAPFKACNGAPPATTTLVTAPTDEPDTSNTSTVPTPTANAGPDIVVRQGQVAIMAGYAENASAWIGGSGDPSYSWTQIAGPSVTLTGAAAAMASFTATTCYSGCQLYHGVDRQVSLKGHKFLERSHRHR